MHTLIMALIVAVLSFRYLTSNGWAPGILNYTPELLALTAAVLVVVFGVRSRFRYVHPSYWVTFGALALIAFCGAIINSLEPGTAFAALRSYLRALPLFFLPAVIALENRHLRTQLYLLITACCVQFPLAWQQRQASVAAGRLTGDLTTGTLGGPAQLTLFLVSAAAVLTAFYVRKRLPAKYFFPLLVLFLAPTTINETKATLVVAPLALLAVFIVGTRPGKRLRKGLLAVGLITCFVAAFVPIYDYYIQDRWGYGLAEFVTRDGRLEGYLDRDMQVGEYEGTAGKIGSPSIALQAVSRDPTTLFFGLGIGAISLSSLGDAFTGRYARIYGPLMENSIAYFIFEIGIAGVLLVCLLMWLIFKDALYVARTDSGMMGALAAGWAGVVVVMAIGILYKRVVDSEALSFLFWYFSGLVAAQRMRLALGAALEVTNRRLPATTGDHPPVSVDRPATV